MILNSHLARMLIQSIPSEDELREICLSIRDPALKEKMLDLKIELTLFRKIYDMEMKEDEKTNNN